MGAIIPFPRPRLPEERPESALPRVLAGLIEAGLSEVALEAALAWGRGEQDPAAILDYCRTYAAVAGVRRLL